MHSLRSTDGPDFGIVEHGRPKPALELLRIVFEFGVPEHEIALDLGTALVQSGWPRAALQVLERVHGIEPDCRALVLTRVGLFVGISNGLWAVFLLWAMGLAVEMIYANSYAISY